jgi:phosphonopyruvate decarboxylase
MLFFIGWRGHPETKDEPQHFFQGKITKDLLKILEIQHEILNTDTKESIKQIDRVIDIIEKTQKPFAIIVRKNTFSKYSFKKLNNTYSLNRESCLKIILKNLKGDDLIVSTTGKTSRELYEISQKNKTTNPIFYTIGGMGHSSQIALGISNFSSKRVFCFDGDGSIIMHMGSLGIIGKNSKGNFIHFLFNNGTHESVGGQPTIGKEINFESLSTSLGYRKFFEVNSKKKLEELLKNLDNLFEFPVFIEVKIKSSSRLELGRPSETPLQQKQNFFKKINV